MAQLDAATVDNVPPIPTRTHRNITKQHHNSSSSRNRPKSLPQTPPAGAGSSRNSQLKSPSPEVISSLINSLHDLSKPLSDPYDQLPSLSLPTTPGIGSPNGNGAGAGASPISASVGSFGVDYGAFAVSHHDTFEIQGSSLSLDELSASSPIIRTAPLPSGLSALTAPKSPRSVRSISRDSSGGLRSLIRRGSANNSRPSSNDGSILSLKNEETQSLGNISIERGSAPATPSSELKRQRSSGDSWSSKLNRNSKGLMYMSSKERLRGREVEKKRSSVSSAPGRSASQGRESFMAEHPISEEPLGHQLDTSTDSAMLDPNRLIPDRESSLKQTGSNAKRSSLRRPKRDHRASADDAIPETSEDMIKRDPKRSGSFLDPAYAAAGRSFLLLDELEEPPYTTPAAALEILQSIEAKDDVPAAAEEEEDDGAPFPAVSQNRKREEEYDVRRFSGLPSPPPEGFIPKSKQTSIRIKRLSPLPGATNGSSKRDSSTDGRQPAAAPPASLLERPDSADSVDDAVEVYLASPRLSQKVKHPQTGRTICFSDVGDINGSAVFCCVGMGLTRFITAFYDELATTLKLRLITLDRPGVGGSDPYTDGTTTPLSWPDDVYAICQALKITKFSILAHSAGAIYALATALRMPQHIRGKIHLLAPWIPPSQMSTWGGNQTVPPTNSIPTAQRVLRALPTPLLKAVNSSFMSATSASITSSLPKEKKKKRRRSATQGDKQPRATGNAGNTAAQTDRETFLAAADSSPPRPTTSKGNAATQANARGMEDDMLTAAEQAVAEKERQSAYDMRLTYSIWSAATTNANPAIDLLVCLERQHAIGFRYVDITRPIVIHHGSRDNRVPVENVKWLGKSMKKCEVRILEGEGHGLMASATVMGSVLMEISREWENWIRVTGGGGGKESGRSRRGTLRREGSRSDIMG